MSIESVSAVIPITKVQQKKKHRKYLAMDKVIRVTNKNKDKKIIITLLSETHLNFEFS